ELNVKKLDFVVDGGCAAYTSDPLTRNTFRSTAMHSTIHLTHIEQNRWSPGVGGLFQLLEKAEPSLHVENDAVIVGCHRGYGAPHSRRFKLDVTGLLIEDEFVDDRERYLVFNLHPDVSVTFVNREGDKFSFALQHAAGVVIGLSVVGCESFELMDGAYSTGYLRRSRNQRLSLRLKEHRARSVVTW
ncbi:MAG: hypothetical protein FJ184_14950, partial [Gammaproteobacteria bacterium]|nr:hypothetical protein [Gammaproteobacteria bacterium]